jgi:hypothetical protein
LSSQTSQSFLLARYRVVIDDGAAGGQHLTRGAVVAVILEGFKLEDFILHLRFGALDA